MIKSTQASISININQNIDKETYKDIEEKITKTLDENEIFIRNISSFNHFEGKLIKSTPQELKKKTLEDIEIIKKEINKEKDNERMLRLAEDLKYYATILHTLEIIEK